MSPTKAPFDYLLNNAPMVTYVCKAYGDFGATYVSQNIESQLGYSPESFLNDSGFWLNNIHPEDRDRILNGLEHLFQNDRHVHQYRFKAADGLYRWMRDQLVLVRDKTGKPWEIVGYWIDITDLVNINESHEAIFHNVADGIILIDESCNVRAFNPIAEKLFGYSSKEVIGKNINMLMPGHHKEAHDGYVKRYLKTGEGRIIGQGSREVEAQRKDGSIIPIDLRKL
ncbi:MAG: PAS domain S-box protein [Sedimenticola sp.]